MCLMEGNGMEETIMENSRKPRTDIHRPGSITPSDYVFLVYYFFDPYIDGSGKPNPGPGVEEAEKILQNGTRAETGRHQSIHNCTVCGAHYKEGAVLKHIPTGHLITMGHDCSDKYELRSDWTEIDLAGDRHRMAKQKAESRIRNAETRKALLDANSDLSKSFAYGEEQRGKNEFNRYRSSRVDIINDIADKLNKYANLSEAQINFAIKLHADLTKPYDAPSEDVKVPAPEGRLVFTGKVVSVKEYESDWGDSVKMTLKVTTPEGVWLAWGTAKGNVEKGQEVTLKATVTKSDKDPSFAFFKRPIFDFVEKPKKTKKVKVAADPELPLI